MKIYTKTGDAGETGLYGNARALKNDARITAIGEVDEANSFLGVALCHCRQEKQLAAVSQTISLLQKNLFDAGGVLAGSKWEVEHAGNLASTTRRLENEMDGFTDFLSPLKNFILPGGTLAAATLHQSRCVLRRAERAVVGLNSDNKVPQEIMMFLNRGSDWLFLAARMANAVAKVDDVPWSHER